MDAISEVAALDAVKRKSKKSSASETVADAVSSVDMNHDSNEKNGKDRSRKEKKEKNISGIDMKDHKREKKKKTNQMGSVEEASNVLEASDREVHVGSEHIGFNDLKTRKKEKIMAKDKKNMNYGNNTDTKVDEVVGSDLKQLKEGKEQAREGHLKKKKMIEPERKEIIDVELVQGQEGKAREKEKLKKKSHKNKKELSRTEHDYACENGSVGHDGSVEPAPDRKGKKKKREEDLGTELLHDTSSKKKKEKSGTSITGDTCISASVGSEWDRAAGDDDVAEKVSSNKDKKKKEEKGDSSSLNDVENCGSGGSKKKNKKSKGSDTERDADAGVSKTNKRKKAIEMSEKSTSRKKSKRVRFSGKDEVFSLPGGSSQGKKEQDGNKSDDGLVRGKRFSKEEDELVKKAVLDYIETHQLGEEGIQMVMKCKSYPEIKDCWKEIGESLPWRPSTAVYYRAHILFERCESREWTEEEIELVRKFHEKHGADWRTLADELGKHRIHVKDTWRRIKLPNRKNGHWSQEEYQALFELVNTDLSLKAFQEKKSKHGMLRDNISWEAISEKHGTRTTPTCCYKWYNQLTSPLVAEGKWSDTDDYRLLIALVDLDAACEADVDWDNLLEHRSGEICRKRWNQMVRHIGEHGIKPFNEQVEVLSKRYCASLLEARETYENKPYVE